MLASLSFYSGCVASYRGALQGNLQGSDAQARQISHPIWPATKQQRGLGTAGFDADRLPHLRLRQWWGRAGQQHSTRCDPLSRPAFWPSRWTPIIRGGWQTELLFPFFFIYHRASLTSCRLPNFLVLHHLVLCNSHHACAPRPTLSPARTVQLHTHLHRNIRSALFLPTCC